MNEPQDTHNKNKRIGSSRGVPSRPPIEWPDRKVTSDSDRATEFARNQLHRTYLRDGEPNAPQPKKQKVIEPTKPLVEIAQDAAAQHHVMREEPYDWQQYHSAWQQYYHQYFYRYYATWWQQQRQQNQATKQQPTSLPQNPASVYAPTEQADPIASNQTAEIKGKIRQSVESRAKRFTSSSHFKPLLGAMSVAAIFLFLNYNQIMIGSIKQYIAPGNVVTTPVIVEPNANASIGQNPQIIIPKIGVDAPVVYDEPRVDNPNYEKALERGVVRLGNSADPGTKGNVVIGGHSSNNVFSPGKYKYVFVNLKQLDVGDVFYLNFKGVRYTYKITVAHKIITPKDVSVLAQTNTPIVTLFTCDPPGTNINRLIIQAAQIDPDPNAATSSSAQQDTGNNANQIPSTSQSLWQRLFGN